MTLQQSNMARKNPVFIGHMKTIRASSSPPDCPTQTGDGPSVGANAPMTGSPRLIGGSVETDDGTAHGTKHNKQTNSLFIMFQCFVSGSTPTTTVNHRFGYIRIDHGCFLLLFSSTKMISEKYHKVSM